MTKIICTLGPKTLNKNFLKFSTKNISLLRLNMSHLETNELISLIDFVRKHTKVPLCIDTEGAQIRTKCSKKIKLNKNDKLILTKNNLKGFNLYPSYVFDELKKNDLLDIGFENLKVKVIHELKEKKVLKVVSAGYLDNNKGVHLINRKIALKYLTDKDYEAIKIGKNKKINYFALSFTNSVSDIKKFNSILKKENKIFKIETKNAIKNFNKIVKFGKNYLIDRGDLSKEINIENVPIVQRYLSKLCKKNKKKLFVATNLLESMVEKNYPTRGEANDIFNILENNADGLVLAAETAIGNFPIECVKFLQKMIYSHKNRKNYFYK